MIFQDKYTTEDIKTAVLADSKKTEEEKYKESKKTIVSNDAYLQAEMQQIIIDKMESLRLGLMK